MATLTALTVGNQTVAPFPLDWTNATDGDLGDNSDSTFGGDNTNADKVSTHGWLLNDITDGDFKKMTTLAIVLRYARDLNTVNKLWTSLEARIVSSDMGIILAAGDAVGAFEEIVAGNITTTTITNSSSVAFSYVNTEAVLAAWDSAVVEIRINIDRSKGGNTDEFRVYECDITGTYDDSAVALFEVVQFDTVGSDNPSSSWPFVLPATPTVGNTLIVVLNGRQGNESPESEIVKPDIDWADLAIVNFDPAASQNRREVYSYIKPVESGDGTGHTFTRTATASATAGVLVEIKGLIELDQGPVSAGALSASSVTSPTTGTTSDADELIMAFSATRDGNNLIPFAWSDSMHAAMGHVQTTEIVSMVVTKIVSATGTFQTTFTPSLTSQDIGVVLLTLRQIAAAGAFPPFPRRQQRVVRM